MRMDLAARALPGVFFLFLWWRLSREDFRVSKFRNIWFLRTVAFCLPVYALYFLFPKIALFDPGTVLVLGGLGFRAGIHAALAVSFAVALWLARIWPAGDAKLFFALQFLIFLTDPSGGNYPYRFSLVSLMNIFLSAAVFFVLQSFFWSWWRRVRPRLAFFRTLGLAGARKYFKGEMSFKKIFETAGHIWTITYKNPNWRAALLPRILKLTCGVVLLAAAQKILEKLIPGSSGAAPAAALGAAYFAGRIIYGEVIFILPAALAVLLVSIFYPETGFGFGELAPSAVRLLVFSLTLPAADHFTKMFFYSENVLILAAPVLFAFFGAAYFFGGSSLAAWAGAGAFFGLFWPLIRIFQQEARQRVPSTELKPYTVLSDEFLGRIRAADSNFYQDHLDSIYADGLAPEQAESLAVWLKKKKWVEIETRGTTPFAFWIFFGIFLSAVFQKDIFSLIR